MKHLAIPVLLVGIATSGLAQEAIPFPVSSIHAGAIVDEIRFEQDAGILGALVDLQQVRLERMPLPGGASLDLVLQRMSFDPVKDASTYVDGLPQAFDPLDLTLWKGTVAGSPDSVVSLALASHGSYGFVRDRDQVYHVSAFPGPGGDWSRAHGRVFTEGALNRVGDAGIPGCAADDFNDPQPPPILPPPDGQQGPAGGQTLEVKIAVETDWQLSQNWGSLQAMENYVFALLGAVSDRYLGQINVKLTYPYVQFWTTSNDPWTSQDGGGDCGSVLNEFRSAWQGNIPNGAHLGHMLSGASLGCGVAYLDVLCSQSFGFSLSCCINGGVNFPVTQGSNNWDFIVLAHELGHNFGSPHTHDFCPPLDQCAPNGYWGNCQNQTQCTNQGTNMSYCHLCGGGTANITTFFHNTVVNLMRNEAESSCAPVYDPSTSTIFFDDFESGTLTGWTKKKARIKSGAAHEGAWGARVRQKGKLERTVDTTGFTDIVVRFWRKTKNYDSGEEFRFRYNSGNGWVTLERSQALSWGYVEFELPASANNNPNLQIRFKSYNANEGKERTDLDQIEVLGQ